MLAVSLTDNLQEKVNWTTKLVSLKVHLKMGKRKGKEFSSGKMEIDLKDFTAMIKRMGKGRCTTLKMWLSFKGSGKMINLSLDILLCNSAYLLKVNKKLFFEGILLCYFS